jgi:hypothetical protein
MKLVPLFFIVPKPEGNVQKTKCKGRLWIMNYEIWTN